MNSESPKAAGKAIDASGVVLIAVNLVPLAGVLLWGWSVFNVVVLYWLENVIVGVVNVLKMLTSAPDPKQIVSRWQLKRRIAERAAQSGENDAEKLEQVGTMIDSFGEGSLLRLNHISKIFLVPFFLLHYGFFCFLHGCFVFVLLGGEEQREGLLEGGSSLDEFGHLIREAIATGGGWAVAALVLGHLFSFGFNYIGKGEYRRAAAIVLMIAPYGRVVILHLAIIAGGAAIVALGSPSFLVVLLILGKTALDLFFHRRSHRKLAASLPPVQGDAS